MLVARVGMQRMISHESWRGFDGGHRSIYILTKAENPSGLNWRVGGSEAISD